MAAKADTRQGLESILDSRRTQYWQVLLERLAFDNSALALIHTHRHFFPARRGRLGPTTLPPWALRVGFHAHDIKRDVGDHILLPPTIRLRPSSTNISRVSIP
jgi:hypothetical protein